MGLFALPIWGQGSIKALDEVKGFDKFLLEDSIGTYSKEVKYNAKIREEKVYNVIKPESYTMGDVKLTEISLFAYREIIGTIVCKANEDDFETLLTMFTEQYGKHTKKTGYYSSETYTWQGTELHLSLTKDTSAECVYIYYKSIPAQRKRDEKMIEKANRK